jgi:protocatechuate 3,4-dioxygenase, alpha subunit
MTPAPTPSQTVGPFFGFALPFPGDAGPVAPGDPGAVRIEGQIVDGDGRPVPDAILEAWSGDQFARARSDPEGVFHFTMVKPLPGEGEAPHLDVFVFARGLLRQLLTRIYFPDEAQANSTDPVLEQVPAGRRPTLIARMDGGVLRHDIRLQGGAETVFFAI